MASPVLPSEFDDLVPQANDSLCEKIKNFILFSTKFATWYDWFFNADGTISDAVIALLCAEDCINCSGGGGGGSETTTAGADFNTFQAFSCGTEEQDFVVPAGVTQVYFQIWGGGAGGGAGGGNPYYTCAALPYTGGGGGGGGSGGYRTSIVDVTAGETLSVFAGCGGAGATVPASTEGALACPRSGLSGSNGNASYVARGPTVLAQAGGGFGGAGGIASGAGGAGGAGGTGTNTGNTGSNGGAVTGGAGGAGVDVWDNAGGEGGDGTANSLASPPSAGAAGNPGHVKIWWHA